MALLRFGCVRVVLAALQLCLAGTGFPKQQREMGMVQSARPCHTPSREWECSWCVLGLSAHPRAAWSCRAPVVQHGSPRPWKTRLLWDGALGSV